MQTRNRQRFELRLVHERVAVDMVVQDRSFDFRRQCSRLRPLLFLDLRRRLLRFFFFRFFLLGIADVRFHQGIWGFLRLYVRLLLFHELKPFGEVELGYEVYAGVFEILFVWLSV